MSEIALKVEGLSKKYRLGVLGSKTLRDDVGRLLARLKGKSDPTTMVGSENKLDAVDQEFVWAMKDVSFEVKRGEVLGIIGKNGAGKSTLLKMLSKVTAPTLGSIKTKGRIASLLEVGTGMHPELTGLENIYLNGAILGMTKSEIKSKIDEIIDFAGIAKYINTPIKRYSSGMRVRLGFAVAAFLEPEILIVDEVLAVGDSEFQSKAIGKMKDVSSQGNRTVLFVSHNMASIQQLCTKCMILKRGQVLDFGDTNTVVNKYYQENIEAINDTLYVDLTDNENRESKNQYLTSFKITPNHKEGIIYSCSEVTFDIEYYTPNRIAKPEFGIFIYSENGVLLFIFINSRQNGSINEINGKGKITCNAPNLNLMPGKYFISVQLWIQGDYLDKVEKFLSFNVETAPSQSYKYTTAYDGIMYLDANWS